jgi:hypothetical protein
MSLFGGENDELATPEETLLLGQELKRLTVYERIQIGGMCELAGIDLQLGKITRAQVAAVREEIAELLAEELEPPP